MGPPPKVKADDEQPPPERQLGNLASTNIELCDNGGEESVESWVSGHGQQSRANKQLVGPEGDHRVTTWADEGAETS